MKLQLDRQIYIIDKMNFLDNIKKRLNETVLHNEEEIEEISASDGVAPVATPYAFGQADDNTIEIYGYKKVPKKKKNITTDESVFSKISKELHINEVSYRDYKDYPGMSSKKKLNTAIQECNTALYQIEQFLKQNRKLREEEGLGNDNYWKSTALKLVKMDQRLRGLREEIKRFGLKEILQRIQEEEQNGNI